MRLDIDALRVGESQVDEVITKAFARRGRQRRRLLVLDIAGTRSNYEQQQYALPHGADPLSQRPVLTRARTFVDVPYLST